MKIAIVILNYNGKEDTLTCLTSLSKSTYQNYVTIVVDNASTNDSVACLKAKNEPFILIESQTNLGFAGGSNLGIQKALEMGCSHILLLNNDVIVDANMLFAFAQGAMKFPRALLGGKVFCMDQPDLLDHIGGKWLPKYLKYDLVGFRKKDGPDFSSPMHLDYIYGCAMLIPAEVIHSIGMLEPKFFLYLEEADFCTRAKQAGFDLIFYPDVKLWHKGAASLTEKNPPQAYYFWRNRLLWLERNYKTSDFLHAIFTKMLFYAIKLLIRCVYYEIYMKMSFLFFPKRITKKRLIRRKTIRTSVMGLFDYIRRRFDAGPSWIY